MLAETAVTGVAMTTLTPGLDIEPVSLALNYFRPPRPQAGNLLARARVVNASRLFAVRAEIARCDGTEVDTAGDGFFVRFDSPARALDCARAAREAVKRLGIDIRVGILANASCKAAR
jgi:acyl-coenzyme A thioesterase PaaI-like protein